MVIPAEMEMRVLVAMSVHPVQWVDPVHVVTRVQWDLLEHLGK